jgi:hypothetical protein
LETAQFERKFRDTDRKSERPKPLARNSLWFYRRKSGVPGAADEKKCAFLRKKTCRFAEQKRELRKISGHSRHSGHSGLCFREVVL